MATRDVRAAFAVCCLTVCVLVLLCPHVGCVLVQDREGQSYDLHLLTVEQHTTGSDDQVTISVHFRSSREPQVEWTMAGSDGDTVISEATQTYQRGRGTTQVVTSMYKMYVYLKIGFFDSHYLEVFIRPFTISGDDKRQDLDTVMTRVEPGYDLVYTPGEAFSVDATVPKHIGHNFTWAEEVLDPGELALRLKACYVDPATGKVKDSVTFLDDPRMTSFLQSSRTLDEDSAHWALDFNIPDPGISGYFQFFNIYEHPSDDYPEWDEQFVTEIWETVNIQVHQSPVAGPFPSGYAYVRHGVTRRRYCSPGDWCYVYCYGYGNNIQEATITKDGAAEPLQEGVNLSYKTSHHVVMRARFVAEGDFAGDYMCRVVTQDNASAQATVTVVEKD